MRPRVAESELVTLVATTAQMEKEGKLGKTAMCRWCYNFDKTSGGKPKRSNTTFMCPRCFVPLLEVQP